MSHIIIFLFVGFFVVFWFFFYKEWKISFCKSSAVPHQAVDSVTQKVPALPPPMKQQKL